MMSPPRRYTYVHLVLDVDRQALVRNQTHVLAFVLVRDRDVPSIRDEIDRLNYTEVVTLSRECQVDNSVNVIVQHPNE